MGWRTFILSILIGIVLGIGGYTFFYAQGLSYFSSDPKACANCHIMQAQYDGWQRSSHHAVATCADCHMPSGFIPKYLTKAENGYLHSKAFTLQNFPDPIQIRDKSLRILNQACMKCHSEFVDEIVAHKNLESLDELRTCTRCHSSVGH